MFTELLTAANQARVLLKCSGKDQAERTVCRFALICLDPPNSGLELILLQTWKSSQLHAHSIR